MVAVGCDTAIAQTSRNFRSTMPDMNLGKLFLGKEQEKQINDIITELSYLVPQVKELVEKANEALDHIDSIAKKIDNFLA